MSFFRSLSRSLTILIIVLSAGPLLADERPVDFNSVIEMVPTEYRHLLVQRLSLAEQNRDTWLEAIAAAPAEQRMAMAFLLTNMPEHDLKSLKADFLLRDVALAYAARAKTPWAKAIPDEIFLNEVLPYASLNERRDDWRADFVKRFAPVVQDCKSASEAAQRLNRTVFKELKVSYHATKRRKPDQSPYESVDCGYASCTGLSIILVDACRAVGVPARVAGTPLWFDGSGNHTWVEIWDGQWKFLGAAEPGQFNQTWFADLAAKADDSKPQTRIYASSFRQTGLPFLMVWAPQNTDYPAVDVTGFYRLRKHLNIQVSDPAGKAVAATIYVRQGKRLVAQSPHAPATFDLAANTDYTVQAQLPEGRTVDEMAKLSASDMTIELHEGVNGSK